MDGIKINFMKNLKIELKWALIFMVTMLAWMLLERLVGLHDRYIGQQQYLTMLFVVPAVYVYIEALRDKKRVAYGGRMTYWQGFKSGVIISVIIATCSPLTQWLISYVISPSYFANVIDYSVKTGYYKTVEEAQAYFNYRNYAIQSVVWALAMGVVTTAVVDAFVCRRSRRIKLK